MKFVWESPTQTSDPFYGDLCYQLDIVVNLELFKGRAEFRGCGNVLVLLGEQDRVRIFVFGVEAGDGAGYDLGVDERLLGNRPLRSNLSFPICKGLKSLPPPWTKIWPTTSWRVQKLE